MKKMLIVENDDLSVKLLAKIFRKNFEIFRCASSEEYYETYNTFIFDIIIMDISINGKMSGLELTKQIKASPTYTGTPIICLTDHALNNIKQTAMEAGVDIFHTKPIKMKDLKDSVESLVKSKLVKENL